MTHSEDRGCGLDLAAGDTFDAFFAAKPVFISLLPTRVAR